MLVESLYVDPVVAEIHEVRRRLLKASGSDVQEFRRQLRGREKASGRKVVSGPVRKRTEPTNAVDSRASS
jgi:hypothetical protein